jgi:Domain of unknown function DUF11
MFTIPLRRRGRALRVGLVVLVLSGLAAALLPVGPALAKPRRADIAITGMVAGPAEVLMGEVVGIGIDVANLGTSASDTVTVDVTLPPTLQLRNPGIVGPEWACGFPTPILRCTHTALAPGQVADTLPLSATVVGGTPGDVLTVTAEASTTSRELSTANNTGQASVQLIAAGTIRGTAWIDTDRDGQREPGEPAAPGNGLWEVRIPTEDGNEILPVEVDAEGHYSLAVKPNRYFVEVTISLFALAWDFTTPNVGDEVTDSDVIPFHADEFSSVARSHVFEVTSGSETVIDIGLVENPLT